MEERFTELRIIFPSRSPMSECLLETNSNQLLMPATEIYYGRTFMWTTALILALKYKRTRRLEQLIVGVHSSVSVLIWLFTHFAKINRPACWLSEEMGQPVRLIFFPVFVRFFLFLQGKLIFLNVFLRTEKSRMFFIINPRALKFCMKHPT